MERLRRRREPPLVQERVAAAARRPDTAVEHLRRPVWARVADDARRGSERRPVHPCPQRREPVQPPRGQRDHRHPDPLRVLLARLGRPLRHAHADRGFPAHRDRIATVPDDDAHGVPRTCGHVRRAVDAHAAARSDGPVRRGRGWPADRVCGSLGWEEPPLVPAAGLPDDESAADRRQRDAMEPVGQQLRQRRERNAHDQRHDGRGVRRLGQQRVVR
mmetsp:Transcript_3566/g.11140  ORF Transcript_3566/g.11140 Transcript_3566/m.11140 type:complete len:217 (+) Transcript_3566:107-757(+)